jgi:SAM-dependent methyltransferase
MKIYSELLDKIESYMVRPGLFECGEPKFWDDPYISQNMLEAHLNPNHDAASRKPETIEKTIQHLLQSGLLISGMKVLDLGCGPGLYAERLCCAGIEVVGIDISQRSIDYAKKHAEESGLKIEYNCLNFFDMDYTEEFDAVIQVYGELCTFSDEKRDILLKLIRRVLKKEGIFIFDVSTRAQRMKDGLKNSWYMMGEGFWSPVRHLVFEQGFDYSENDVWLDQYVVVDSRKCKVYRNWFHDYSLDSIKAVLTSAGFETKYVWNELTGSNFTEDGDWIAVGAVKKDMIFYSLK